MKLWLPASLLVIAIIVGSGLAVITYKNQPKKDQVPKLQLEMIQPKLTLQPETTPIKTGEEANLIVSVKTDNLNVIGIQATFTFDPKIIAIVGLEPGTVLPNPDVLLQTIDNDTGTFTYALGTRQPSSGNGILFKIKVQAKTATQSLKSPLSFNQNKTKVATEKADHTKRFSPEETQLIFEEKALSIQ